MMRDSSLNMSLLSPLIIIGTNGAIGSLFQRNLTASDLTIYTIDVAPGENPTENDLCFDITDADSVRQYEHLFSQAACILFCVSDEVILSALPTLLSLVPKNTLFVDTLSVKTDFAKQVSRLIKNDTIEWLSIQPLFRPKDSFADKNVVAAPLRQSGEKSEMFLRWLSSLGANVTQLDIEQHDKILSIIQAATHVQMFALAEVIKQSGFDIDLFKNLETPPFKQLRELMEHIVKGKPENYFEIQQGQYAENIRAQLIEQLQQLSARSNSADLFSSFFLDIREFLAIKNDCVEP